MTSAVELNRLLRALVDDESGATLVEYGLVLLLVAALSLATLTSIGTSLNDIWTKIATAMHPPA